ncbi:MAG: MBL fold metallo-hydrolase [Phycisphaerales bacterium]|nr:MBL fold metallo-hydrolase [Planctomycetota bacterium]MCH8509009.1 MBL fold metallo-hydrolase [Phycisphaerales bacterium]
MITRREALLTGCGLAAALAAMPSRASAAAVARLLRDEPARFFPWTDLGDGLWAVIDPDTGGNCLLALGSDEALLVDTKFPSIGQALLREAQEVGKKLRYAVNTHHHADHTGGNVAFNAAGIETVAHPKAEKRILDNWQQFIQHTARGVGFVGGLKRPTQDQVLREAGELADNLRHLDETDWGPTLLMTGDEMELTFGGRTAQLKHFGRNAHTDNDTVVRIPDANILHTGDLVFAGLHPFFDPSAGVTARGWIGVLRELRAMCDADTRVIPGHGQRGKGDRSLIDDQIEYLERLVESVQAEIEQGVPLDEAVQKSWPFMEGLGFEQIRPRAIAAVYKELSDAD